MYVRVVDLESRALHRSRFRNTAIDLMDTFSSEKAIQLAYRTSVVLFRHPLIPEIMHGGELEGLPPSVKLESRHITFTVVVRLKTQQKDVCYRIIN